MAGYGFGQGSPAKLSAYQPTLRDKASDKVVDFLAKLGVGDNYQRREFAGKLFNGALAPANLIPAFAADEAGRQMASGHPFMGAANLGLAAIPFPAVAKGAKSALKPAAQAVEEFVAHLPHPTPKAPPITAYHGSPHSFDAFDLSKIGTGEGAQAYGHGLYFAENEKVAQGYRDQLSGSLVNGRDPTDGEGYAIQALQAGGGDPAKAIALHHEAMQQNPGWSHDEGLDVLRGWHANGVPEITSPGSMYQVGINAHPDHFLDWDRPLSRDYVEQRFGAFPHVVEGDAKQRAFLGADKGYTGQAAYAKAANWKLGSELSPPNAAETSRLLSEAGIPGIKYLDAGSRGAGDGSRNFVVFDPKHIDILKKYGVAATLMGGAGAMAAGAPDNNGSF